MDLTSVCLGLWSASLSTAAWGNVYGIQRMKRKGKTLPPDQLPPVSILRPLCGVEDGGVMNIATLLNLDYPTYEVIFSVASPDDPILPALKEILKTSAVQATLVLRESAGFENPKVANLVTSEAVAKYDICVVSDSNVTLTKDYLQTVVPYLTADVGVVSAVVKAWHGDHLGGQLEECQMNSFIARWMNLAAWCGMGFVIGKSMAYRKSVAARFGGIAALGSYLAEDYMMGFEMKQLGLKVAVQQVPVHQYVGRRTVKQYFDRHYRWALLQKHSEPAVFLLEPLQFSFVAGALGAVGWGGLTHSSPWAAVGFVVTVGLMALLDRGMMGAIGSPFKLKAWLLREVLAPLIWAKALVKNEVTWRKTRLKVGRRGKVRRAR